MSDDEMTVRPEDSLAADAYLGEHLCDLLMGEMVDLDMPDPSVSASLADHVIVASWSEAARWTYVDLSRLEALERVAEAARHRQRMGAAATKAIQDNRDGLIDVHAYNAAMDAKADAEAELHRAVAALDGQS